LDIKVLSNMERMELNQPELQFMFNVIAITAIASLALICILLKRDKNKLTSELNSRRIQDRNQPSVGTLEQGPNREPNVSTLEEGPNREPSVSTLEQGPNREPSCPVAPDALEIMRQDIRQYVARRVQGWNVGPRTR
jgi:hypothetical protein